MSLDLFKIILVPTALTGVLVLLCHLPEKFRPARPQKPTALIFNILYLVPYNLLHALTVPLCAAGTVWTINKMGGGIIVLPSNGWWLVAGIIVYLLVMDFGEFVFHVAQHKIPILWAMHSFHHSDMDLNVSTTQRHFWGDLALKSVSIYTIVGILFRANQIIIASYGIIALYNFFLHMNIRIGFGRLSWLVNTPQYHRLHHSSRIEDRDLRYAALFPIFDVVFGTYRQPSANDYPATGLDTGRIPRNLWEAIFWPMMRGRPVTTCEESRSL